MTYSFKVVFQGQDLGVYTQSGESEARALRFLQKRLYGLSVGKVKDFVITSCST